MSNAELIERLYEGLRTGNGDDMAACYTDNAQFEDPGFGVLTGEQVGAMWRMLIARSDGIEVELSDIRVDGDTGSAHWVARYTFGPKQRPVVNRISARYRFEDGLIADHVDTFSFHRWARQALGPIGLVLGGTPYLRKQVQGQARRGLDQFLAQSDGSGSS